MTPPAPDDLSRRRRSFLIGWGVPLVVVFTVSFWPIPTAAAAVALAAGFGWMGASCLFNALRCGRLHCYLAGPVLLAGAVAVLLVGFDVVALDGDGVSNVAWATFAATALTFVPEFFFGRYVSRRGG